MIVLTIRTKGIVSVIGGLWIRDGFWRNVKRWKGTNMMKFSVLVVDNSKGRGCWMLDALMNLFFFFRLLWLLRTFVLWVVLAALVALVALIDERGGWGGLLPGPGGG
jgi:hypothetical protein